MFKGYYYQTEHIWEFLTILQQINIFLCWMLFSPKSFMKNSEVSFVFSFYIEDHSSSMGSHNLNKTYLLNWEINIGICNQLLRANYHIIIMLYWSEQCARLLNNKSYYCRISYLYRQLMNDSSRNIKRDLF